MSEAEPELTPIPEPDEDVLVTSNGSRFHEVGEDGTPDCGAWSRSDPPDWRRRERQQVTPTFDPCWMCFGAPDERRRTGR